MTIVSSKLNVIFYSDAPWCWNILVYVWGKFKELFHTWSIWDMFCFESPNAIVRPKWSYFCSEEAWRIRTTFFSIYSWMLYGKPIYKWMMTGDTPILGNPTIYTHVLHTSWYFHTTSLRWWSGHRSFSGWMTSSLVRGWFSWIIFSHFLNQEILLL